MNKLIKVTALLALLACMSGGVQADGGSGTTGGGLDLLRGLLSGGAHPDDGTGGPAGGGHDRP